ncbi:MAG: hypothetical protein ACO263_08810, partial [Cyclobacteriaceae bacterium]
MKFFINALTVTLFTLLISTSHNALAQNELASISGSLVPATPVSTGVPSLEASVDPSKKGVINFS